MRQSLACFAVFLVLCLACGCQPKARSAGTAAVPSATASAAAPRSAPAEPPLTSQEKLAQQAIQLLNQATDLMASVKDRNSAAMVAPKLKAIAQQLEQLRAQGVPLGIPTDQTAPALGRFRGDMEKAVQRFADVAVRMVAQQDLLGQEFKDALRELGKVSQ